MERRININNKRIINIFIIIAILGITVGTMMSTVTKSIKIDKAVAIVAESDCTVKAELYENKMCTGTGISLTKSGVAISEWDYDQSRFLKITADVDSDDGKQHIIEVTLPKEFYVVSKNLSEVPAGYASVDFVKNENMSVNGGSEVFYVEDNSGKLTYVLDEDISSATIVLEVRYDYALWDKQKGSSITEEGVIPIKVAMKHKGQSSYLKEVKVSSVTAGKGTGRFMWQLIDTMDYNYATTQTKTLYTEILANDKYYEEIYYKEMIITIQHPYWTDSSGKKHYLKCVTDGISVFEEYHPDLEYTIESGESETKIVIDNCYMETGAGELITPFKLPSGLPSVSDKYIEFYKGRIVVTGTSNNGTEGVEVARLGIDAMWYQLDITEDVYVFSQEKREVYNDKTRDGVLYMGGFYLENTGCVDSSRKTITFTYPDELLITTVNIFSDRVSEYIDIEYSLKDDNGNQVYFDSSGNIVNKGTSGAKKTYTFSKKNNYKSDYDREDVLLVLSRQDLPEAHRKYFFKEIKYSIETITENTKMFQESGWSSADGGGNFFGYLRSDVVVDKPYISSIKIESPSDSDTPTISDSFETYVTNEKITSTQIRATVDNAPTEGFRAGDIIKVSGDASGYRYPYGTTNKINDINIGVLLPEGIMLEKDSIKLSTASREVEVEDLYIKGNKNGNNFWVIEVQSDVYVGYFDEYLKRMKEGSGIKFEIDLITDVAMPSTNLYTHEMFCFAGKGYENWSYGPEESTDDVWDINEDGDYESGFAAIPDWKTELISIMGNSLMISAQDSVSIEGQGSVTGNRGVLKATDDKLVYSINVKRLELGTVTDYIQYIPIPKQNSVRDAFLVQGSKDEAFDFRLHSSVTFTGDDIFEALYAVDQELSFYDMKKLDDSKWYTIDEIKSSYSVSDVTAIKVVLKNGVQVSEDFNTTIHVKMVSTNKDNNTEKGEVNVWKSRAYYSINHNTGKVAGYQGTRGCEAEIAYEPGKEYDSDTKDVQASDGVDFSKTASWCEYNGSSEDENGNPYVKIEFRFDPTEYCDLNGYPLHPLVQQDTVVKDREKGKLNINLAIPRIYIKDYIPDEFTLIEDSVKHNDESFTTKLETYTGYKDFEIELHKQFERKEYVVSFVTILDKSKLSDEYISGKKRFNTNGKTIDSSVDSMGSSYLYYDYWALKLESPSLNYNALKTDEDVTDSGKISKNYVDKDNDSDKYDDTPATEDVLDYRKWLWLMMVTCVGMVLHNKKYKKFYN